MIALVVQFGLKLHVTTAFLNFNGKLEEEVNMKQPAGYIANTGSRVGNCYVCRSISVATAQ